MRKLFLFILLLLAVEGAYAQAYTKGTVYDFNIGDEFHYRTSSFGFPSMPNGDHADRILDRYTNSTHLFYEVGNVSLTNSNVILSTRIDSILLSTLLDPVIDTVTSGALGDTILTSDSIITDSILCFSEYLSTNSTLNYPDNYEPPHWLQKFVIGLGEVNYYRSSQGGYASRGLIYYKKGNVSCGESVYITSLHQISQNISTKISPNPFTNQISIQFGVTPKQIVQFNLYNNLGQLILKKAIDGNDPITIPIAKDIPKGVYYGMVHIGNQIQTIKLLKQ